MPLVVFGDQLSEMNNISYCIEHAFDTHRQKLINIVEKLAQIDEQMNQFDDIYGNMLTSVHNRFVSFASSLPQCWELNEHFLRELIQPHAVPFTLGILPASSLSPLTPVRFGKDKHNDISSYNSLVQVLVHLDRDWSKDGENVRNILYRRGVLRYLDLYFPLNGEESDAPSVLIPGAGLGRLGFDIALAGYRVEENECSAAMLCATYTLFKELVPNGEVWQFFPHLHFPLQDDWDLEQKLRNVSIPYIEDSEIKDSTSVKSAIDRITLQYGDFVGVYGSFTSVHEARFDIVVTCFFIDTGRSILEYIEVIKFVLKAGGIWINVGPLHYHNPQAVPYSYRDVLSIVQLLGFELLKEEKLIMSYCGEEYVSMKPEMYNTPIAAFRKRSLTDEATTAQTTPQVKLHLDHPDYIIKR